MRPLFLIYNSSEAHPTSLFSAKCSNIWPLPLEEYARALVSHCLGSGHNNPPGCEVSSVGCVYNMFADKAHCARSKMPKLLVLPSYAELTSSREFSEFCRGAYCPCVLYVLASALKNRLLVRRPLPANRLRYRGTEARHRCDSVSGLSVFPSVLTQLPVGAFSSANRLIAMSTATSD